MQLSEDALLLLKRLKQGGPLSENFLMLGEMAKIFGGRPEAQARATNELAGEGLVLVAPTGELALSDIGGELELPESDVASLSPP